MARELDNQSAAGVLELPEQPRRPIFLFTPDAPGLYRPINLRLFLTRGDRREILLISMAWILTCIFCVSFGWWCAANYVAYDTIFGFQVGDLAFTLFLPLPICLLWVLLWGYSWGAIPSYLATLTVALVSHMPVQWAILFACTNPITLAVYTIVYRALPVQLSLRRVGPILFFAIIGLLSAVFSAAGSFIWSHTNSVELSAVQIIDNWYDWWLNGFVTQVLIVGPILFFVFPVIERLKMNRVWTPTNVNMAKRNIIVLLGIVVASILLFCYLTLQLNESLFQTAIESGEITQLSEAFEETLQSNRAFYWVMGATLLLVVLLSFQFYRLWTNALADAKAEAESLARSDFLTGLKNRRAFFEFAVNIVEQAKRYNRPYVLSIVDIDHFKTVNDTWGHDKGDEVLKALSGVITGQIRSTDIVARFGGDEFILMMPETSIEQARISVERIREKVEELDLRGNDGEDIRLSISGGIACPSSTEDDLEVVMRKADDALYKAKENRRNRIEG